MAQVSGVTRVILVDAEHGLGHLAPFPTVHPYDGYRCAWVLCCGHATGQAERAWASLHRASVGEHLRPEHAHNDYVKIT